jgi:uncharacterized alpha-E superfamily protein
MNGNRPLLSRVADSIYWMARYIERAENVARFIGVNLHLHLDLPLATAHQWLPLIDTSGDYDSFKERYGAPSQENVIEFLTLDEASPNSIFSCLMAARENARSIRETISSEMWEQINGMYLQTLSQRDMPETERLIEMLRGIRIACHLFQGLTDSTMSHNEAWHFLRLGRTLERADKTSRILDVKYYILLPSVGTVGTPYDDLHWAAVLKSVSGFEMYRKKYGHISPRDIVGFLVTDKEFPRAIHHCMHVADESLHAVSGTPLGSFRFPSEQLMGQLRSQLDFTTIDQILREGLHEFIDGLQVKMNQIGDSLQSDFFAWRQREIPVESRGHVE